MQGYTREGSNSLTSWLCYCQTQSAGPCTWDLTTWGPIRAWLYSWRDSWTCKSLRQQRKWCSHASCAVYQYCVMTIFCSYLYIIKHTQRLNITRFWTLQYFIPSNIINHTRKYVITQISCEITGAVWLSHSNLFSYTNVDE